MKAIKITTSVVERFETGVQGRPAAGNYNINIEPAVLVEHSISSDEENILKSLSPEELANIQGMVARLVGCLGHTIYIVKD